jgi:hypothetical protein
MQPQEQIEELKARITALEKMLHGGDVEFNHIACKSWTIYGEDGKARISAVLYQDGSAKLTLGDRGNVRRIELCAGFEDEQEVESAGVRMYDRRGSSMIEALTSSRRARFIVRGSEGEPRLEVDSDK